MMKSIWSMHQHCMLGGTGTCPTAYMMLSAEGMMDKTHNILRWAT